MIQRIQSVWLLLAALLNGALFITKLYTASVLPKDATTPVNVQLTISGDYSLLVASLIIIIIPALAIFMFKNRKNQKNNIIGAIVANLGFITLMLMKITAFNNAPSAPANGQYSVGAILPILSLIFLILAMRGVIKDDKLVKSTDRLR